MPAQPDREPDEADRRHMGPPWTWEPGDRDPQPDTNPA